MACGLGTKTDWRCILLGFFFVVVRGGGGGLVVVLLLLFFGGKGGHSHVSSIDIKQMISECQTKIR